MNSIRSSIRDALCHRLSVIGTPRHLNPLLVDLWCHWVTHNGPEWAVKRFKSLKVDLIRQHSNFNMLTPYVRKNKRGKYYGVIGALFNWAKLGEKQFSRTLQCFCIYTSETSKVETPSQLKKFLSAVSCQVPTGLNLDDLTKITWTAEMLVGSQQVTRCDNRLITYRGSPEKIAPLPHNQGYTPQDKNILAELSWLRTSKNLAHYLEFIDLYGPVTKDIGFPTRFHHLDKLDYTSFAGEVHFIQEPGYKLRSVASPYRIHQLALKPLGDSLGKIVQSLPWDCTFDQSKAFPIIQEKLRQGRVVYSVDLSSATDYFPLDLQLMVLRQIFGNISDIRLFEKVSRMDWKSKYGNLRWARGQPLGLYPSFFAFTLTHGLVLAFLAEHETNKFLVVGDDVVIFDEELYNRYLSFLRRTGCPFSSEKSLSSSLSAEFAGKVVTPDRVIPQLKWRKMSNDSFLDLASLLGRRSRELMTTRQQKVFDAVMHLLPPVGLNMSTKGSNYLSSFLDTEKFLALMAQNTVSSLTELIRTIQNNSLDDPCASVIYADTRTFDEKVRKVFQQTVFGHWLWLEQLADLPQALGLEPRLPIKAYPRRVSTLSRYERLLNRVTK